MNHAKTSKRINEVEVPSELPKTVDLADQPLIPGSFAVVNLEGISATRQITIDLHLYPTRPEETQTVLELSGSESFRIAIILREQQLLCVLGDSEVSLSSENLIEQRWYHLQISHDVASGGKFAARLN